METCPGCNGPFAKDETGNWIKIGTSPIKYWHETNHVEKKPHYPGFVVYWIKCTGNDPVSKRASLTNAVSKLIIDF